MRKTLFGGVDLHSNNARDVIRDGRDRQRLAKRLPNPLPTIPEALEPFHSRLKVVAVESTYNWYWLVDGLMEHAQLKPTYERLQTMPGVGAVLTLFWSRRSRDGVRPWCEARGHEAQIQMDACTKEPPAGGRRTRYAAPGNFAGAKRSPAAGTFRSMDVTLQNSRQKAETSPISWGRRTSVQRESSFT